MDQQLVSDKKLKDIGRKVWKNRFITKDDLRKYYGFMDEFRKISREHSDWCDSMGKGPKYEGITRYNDHKILEKYGSDIAVKGEVIHHEWMELRDSISQYLEKKDLPLEYPKRVWTSLYIGCEGGTRSYSGDLVPMGNNFDTGPGKWCAEVLSSLGSELYERKRLQKIEWYTKWGLMAGIFGAALGLLSICIALS